MKRPRLNPFPGLKVDVALVNLRGGKSLIELADQVDLRPNWRTQSRRRDAKRGRGLQPGR